MQVSLAVLLILLPLLNCLDCPAGRIAYEVLSSSRGSITEAKAHQLESQISKRCSRELLLHNDPDRCVMNCELLLEELMGSHRDTTNTREMEKVVIASLCEQCVEKFEKAKKTLLNAGLLTTENVDERVFQLHDMIHSCDSRVRFGEIPGICEYFHMKYMRVLREVNATDLNPREECNELRFCPFTLDNFQKK